MQDTKYKKNWSTSSENEFGYLANGVGGRIKNTTNTMKFIRIKDFQGLEGRMLLMVPLCAMSAMKKPRKTEHVSSWEEIESTIPVR